MRKSLRATLAAAVVAAVLAPAPGRADALGTFIERTCGVGCPDPSGEESRLRATWSALSAMGTTDFVGANVGGLTLDASALLAGARLVGASELDNWFRTGALPTSVPDGANAVLQAMSAASGLDVSTVTGLSPRPTSYPSTDPATGLPSMQTVQSASQLSGGFNPLALADPLDLVSRMGAVGYYSGPGGGGTSGYCSPQVAQALSQNGQTNIQNMMRLATSGDYGFSQIGGTPISAGQRSPNGFFGLSCLEKMMQTPRDILFKPPGLSQLVGMVQSMLGGGGGGDVCKGAISVLQQVQGSLPTGAMQSSGGGGFFPYLEFGSGQQGTGSSDPTFSNAFNLLRASPSQVVQPSLSGLFR